VRRPWVLGSIGLVACGGDRSPVPAAPPAAPPIEAAAEPTAAIDPPAAAPVQAPPDRLPTSCSGDGEACVPPGDFVERLCAHTHQDLALALFTKASVFTRLYLRGKLDELVFDEEVLALRHHRAQKGGIVVGSGSGSYDVLRWDGTCSTAVDEGMLTRSRPPQPRSARIQWHRLGDEMQTSLVTSSPSVKKAHTRRGKECKGAMTGEVSATCVEADAALGKAVAEYVRNGGALPQPAMP